LARNLKINLKYINISREEIMPKSEPVIIIFACQWCAYQGADDAGNQKYCYPHDTYIIKVPCTGRVELEFVIEALKRGADGVLIGGCHLGDCHYRDGNYKAKIRINLLKRVLKDMGIEPERVQIEWISASEGKKFVKTVKDFALKIKNLEKIEKDE
jgi:F420-non-reducing hydrogenase iron-sulfur subunit